MKTPRWEATLRMRSLQKAYLGSQSDLCPLNALNLAVAITSSSQSATSFLMNSSTVRDNIEEEDDPSTISLSFHFKDTYPPICPKLVLKRNEAPTSQPKLRRIEVFLFGNWENGGKQD